MSQDNVVLLIMIMCKRLSSLTLCSFQTNLSPAASRWIRLLFMKPFFQVHRHLVRSFSEWTYVYCTPSFLVKLFSLFAFAFLFKTGSHVAQAGIKLDIVEADLELLILLSLSPQCWHYRSHHTQLLLLFLRKYESGPVLQVRKPYQFPLIFYTATLFLYVTLKAQTVML